MKVLQINTEKGWRGGERQTLFLARGLADRGLEVTVLARSGHPLAERAARHGLDVLEAGSTAGALALLAVRGNRFDVLHAQTAKAQGLAVLTKPLHRRPLVYTRRVDFAPRGLAARLKYAATDRVTAISTAISQVLAGFGLHGVPVISSIARPVQPDPETVAGLGREHNPRGLKVAATVGAFVPHKDPLTMVRAVAHLAGMREDFVFWHFGQGPLMDRARAEVRRLGIARVYRFMGFVDDLAPCYALMDAFAMSSQEEGLGSSVLDAFLAGVPVAATRAGGLAELVQGRGLTSPVHDAVTLARNLDILLTGGPRIDEFRRAARDYALAHHDMDTIAARYAGLYEEILDPARDWA
jgi:glycosyltransferase involved in cell wall biosynthesis